MIMIWKKNNPAIFRLVTVCIFSVFHIITSNAQDSSKVFEGYILEEDSFPVENAYVINYRDQKIVATDSTGYFKTDFEDGDSLMINHISLSPTVIHANSQKASENLYIIDYKMYTLQTFVKQDEDKSRDLRNFEANISKIYKDLEKEGFRMGLSMDQLRKEDLPFFMDMMGKGPNASVNLLSIRDLLQQRRRKKYASFSDE